MEYYPTLVSVEDQQRNTNQNWNTNCIIWTWIITKTGILSLAFNYLVHITMTIWVNDMMKQFQTRAAFPRKHQGHTILNIVWDLLLRTFMFVSPKCRLTVRSHDKRVYQHQIEEWHALTCLKNLIQWRIKPSPDWMSSRTCSALLTISSLRPATKIPR